MLERAAPAPAPPPPLEPPAPAPGLDMSDSTPNANDSIWEARRKRLNRNLINFRAANTARLLRTPEEVMLERAAKVFESDIRWVRGTTGPMIFGPVINPSLFPRRRELSVSDGADAEVAPSPDPPAPAPAPPPPLEPPAPAPAPPPPPAPDVPNPWEHLRGQLSNNPRPRSVIGTGQVLNLFRRSTDPIRNLYLDSQRQLLPYAQISINCEEYFQGIFNGTRVRYPLPLPPPVSVPGGGAAAADPPPPAEQAAAADAGASAGPAAAAADPPPPADSAAGGALAGPAAADPPLPADSAASAGQPADPGLGADAGALAGQAPVPGAAPDPVVGADVVQPEEVVDLTASTPPRDDPPSESAAQPADVVDLTISRLPADQPGPSGPSAADDPSLAHLPAEDPAEFAARQVRMEAHRARLAREKAAAAAAPAVEDPPPPPPDQPKRAQEWRTRGKWVNPTDMEQNAVFERDTLPPGIAWDASSPVNYWRQSLEKHPRFGVWDGVRHNREWGLHSGELRDITGLDHTHLSLCVRSLLDRLMPGRKGFGERYVNIRTPRGCDDAKVLNDAFNFGESGIPPDVKRDRRDNFRNAISKGVKVLHHTASDAGGVFPEWILQLLQDLCQKCVVLNIMFIDKVNNTDVYRFNLGAFKNGCSNIAEKNLTLQHLTIAVLLCLSNQTLRGVTVNIDPIFFAGMFIESGNLTHEHVAQAILPPVASPSIPYDEMILFAQEMSTGRREQRFLTLAQSQMAIADKITPNFRFAGDLDDGVHVHVPDVEDGRVLNVVHSMWYLDNLSSPTRRIFQEWMVRFDLFFDAANVSRDKIKRFTDSHVFNIYSGKFERGESTRASLRRVDLSGVNISTAYAMHWLFNVRVHRSGLTFIDDPDLDPPSYKLRGYYEIRKNAIQSIVMSMPNPENVQDTPRISRQSMNYFSTEDPFSFSRGRGEDDQRFRQRISNLIPALGFNYTADTDFDEDTKATFCDHIKQVNGLLLYAQRHAMVGAAEVSVYPVAELIALPTQSIDFDKIFEIHAWIISITKVAIDAHIHLLAAYEQSQRAAGAMSFDQLNASFATGKTAPFLNSIELNCPVAGEGRICSTCSMNVCEFCYFQDEACVGCKNKSAVVSIKRYTDIVSGSSPCNETSPLQIKFANAMFDRQTENGKRLSDGRINYSYHFHTCFNRHDLMPNGMTFESNDWGGLRFDLRKSLRHEAHDLLTATSGLTRGFDGS